MRIPDIQARMCELAQELTERGEERLDRIAHEIHALVQELFRRKARRKAEPYATPISPRLNDAIRAYAAAHPDMPFELIAARFKLNIGRVSTAINGKRK